MDQKVHLLDCTLRDGGYYNDWDFEPVMVAKYFQAMSAVSADFVEVGLRSFESHGFKGGFAYGTDDFILNLPIPAGLNIGVMVNASELLKYEGGPIAALQKLFKPAAQSPVKLVRIACHAYEFEAILPGVAWLKQQGYLVGGNMMQIADLPEQEIEKLANAASQYPLDALYFADSMGSMTPDQTTRIIGIIRRGWAGAIGIHTHDNMGNALANSLRAVADGATWIDGTVTGMGRGPGNVKTEHLVIELEQFRQVKPDLTPLLSVIEQHFRPMQVKCGWGTNTYYFLAGKYGIHPTYVQEMLSDSRYTEEDILAVIEYLQSKGGKKFRAEDLETGRNILNGGSDGHWNPAEQLSGKDLLVVGAGPSARRHRAEIERYIRNKKPVVISLNTQASISADLIQLRAACHPIRLLADSKEHTKLPQPLITPVSALPDNVKEVLKDKPLLDYGLSIKESTFEFNETSCVIPNSLVISYVLAMAASGKANRILLAGFDGYGADDPRSHELDRVFSLYANVEAAPPVISVTPTKYKIDTTSIYALGGYE
ncbi:aldolase [Pseudomethylobacillus aquaticus]|uniref:Aldolase n=1 Tax=Pseudomethylobacillus aquaticus TaxID=2676064 RepID=A0A3N0V3E4_9PROT|nr:aldolase catalytic domain-containing protein [Pseudomethylobacillus aquaticus]ROH87074.1 aldolase [Pseudomethylobacillus aquaticus]